MSAQGTNLSGWSAALDPAHCGACHAGFLVPASAGAPLCPNCLAARLEPVPAVEANPPPEWIVPFNIAPVTLNANLERWMRDIPFPSATLNPASLNSRLTPLYLPMYLADVSVWGTWSAQMGFDYLVASSEERYSNGQWVTQRLNETRIRREPRAGDISRRYENLPVPALEQHTFKNQTGQDTLAGFDTSRAVPYTAQTLANAFVRTPEITTEAAVPFARQELERRAARDCQTAASAQHLEQFAIRAAFGEPNWTLLLLPMYVTSYSDDEGHWLAVRVNGQTGAVSGIKHSSMKTARRWTMLFGGIAFFLLLFSAALVLLSNIVSQAQVWVAVVVFLALVVCLATPTPLIIAWEYNRRQRA